MSKIRKNTGIWKYLEETGVLEHGTEAEIQAARKEYQKKYILQYKRKQRGEMKEYIVLLKKDEQTLFKEAAQKHKTTIVRFLKTAALAYLEKKYIVPDQVQVAHLEQTLIQILNEIQALAKRNKILFTLNIQEIEKKINRMETVVNDILRSPETIEEYFKNNPSLPAQSPNHDCENQDTQKAEF